jgi:hypothetical protein
MGHLPTRWNALAVVLALASMLGCQGLSTSKPASQGSQNPLPGGLNAAPASISFGNVQIGTSQSQSDTVTNTGGTSLTITQATVTGSGFSTTGLNLPLTLAAGQSTTFSIVFSPQSAGSVTGNLALINGGSNSPLNIALAGTAVTAGSVTENPTSFAFGSVQVGTNQTQTETLKNTGGENLTISQATVSGSGFSYTGLSLPLTLVPNQSTTFGVVFAPTSAGASNGILSVTVSGSSTSIDFALSGTGVTPATLTATPASMTFTNVQVGQNQTQTETVQNTGGSNATISQASVSGSGFSISGLGTNVTLTPGQSASFSVTFTPQSAGNFSGSVAIASNASNPNLGVTLSGSAITQSSGTLSVSPVNAGSVTVGTSGTQTGTLSATGASVSVSSVSLSGTNPSEFSISGLSFPVTVTTSQPITFTVTFTPGRPEPRRHRFLLPVPPPTHQAQPPSRAVAQPPPFIASAWRGRPATRRVLPATTCTAPSTGQVLAVPIRTLGPRQVPLRRIPTAWWPMARLTATRQPRWIRVAKVDIPILPKP